MESVEAHLQQLSTAVEDIWTSISDAGFINDVIDGFTTVVGLVDSFIDGADQGMGVWVTFGTIVANVFNKQIGSAITNQITKLQTFAANREALATSEAWANAGVAKDNSNGSIDQAKNYEYSKDIEIENNLQQQKTRIFQDHIQRTQELRDLNGSIEQQDFNKLSNLSEEVSKLELEKLELQAILEEMKASNVNIEKEVVYLEDEENKLEEIGQRRDSLKQKLQDYTGLLKQAEQSENQKVTILDAQGNAINSQTQEVKKNKVEVQKLKKELEETTQEYTEQESIVKNLQKYSQTKTKKGSLEQEAGAKEKTFYEGQAPKEGEPDSGVLGVNQAKTEQASSELIQTFTGLTMAVNAFYSTWNVLNNEDMTFFEKFSTISTTLLFQLPMIANGLKNITSIGKNLSTVLTGVFDGISHSLDAVMMEKNTAAQKANTAATNENSTAKKQNAVATTEETVSKEVNTDANIENAVSEEGGTGGTKSKTPSLLGKNAKEAVTKLGEYIQASKGAKAASAGVEAGAEAVGTGMAAAGEGTGAAASAMGGLTGAFGTGLLAIGGVTAALGAVAIAAYAAYRNYTKQERAAQEAADIAKEVAEGNEKVAQTYDDFQSAVDAYESAKDQLDECTKGTEEWNEALKETNSTITDLLNLIQQLPAEQLVELEAEYGDLYNRDTGYVNEDILNEVEEQLARNESASSTASAMADLNADIKSARSDLLTGIRNEGGGFTVYDSKSGGNKTTTAEDIQSIFIDNIDEFANLGEKEFQEKLKEFNLDPLIDSADELADYTTEYANAVDAAVSALDSQVDLEVRSLLGEDAEEGIVQGVSNIVQNAVSDTKVSDQADKWNDEMSKLATGNNATYQKIIKQLEDAGYATGGVSGQKAVTGIDKNRQITYLDTEGEEQTADINTIANWVLASEALDGVEDSANKVSKAFSTLEKNVSEDFADGISDFVATGTLESLNQEDFDTFKEDVSKNGVISKDSVSNGLQGLTGLDEKGVFDLFGVESQEELKTKIQTAIKNYESAFSDFTDDFTNAAMSAYDQIEISDNVSPSAKKAVAQYLQNAVIQGGGDNYDSLDTIGATFKHINEDGDIDTFVDSLSDVSDWSTVSEEDLTTMLTKAGISTKEMANISLPAFIEAMQEASGATEKTISEITDVYASIHDIIDGLEYGDTIEADDYNTIIENFGSEMSQYFTMMADGTYKLTTDAEKFYEACQTQLIDQFVDYSDTLKEQIATQSDLIEKVKNNDGSLTTINGATSLDTLETQKNLILATGGVEDEDALIKTYEKTKEVLTDFQNLNLQDYSSPREATNAGDRLIEELADTGWDEYLPDSITDETYQQLEEQQKEYIDQLYQTQLAIAETATDLTELEELRDNGSLTSDDAFNTAYENIWQEERTEDLDQEEIDTYAEHLQEIADESDDVADSLAKHKDTAKELATEILNMNDAIQTLSDNWEDWRSILKKSSKSSEEYATAMASTKDAISKLLDIDDEYITEDLVTEHMSEISKAAKGDADAIDALRDAALDEILVKLNIDDSEVYNGKTISDIKDYFDKTLTKTGQTISLKTDVKGAKTYINALQDMIDTMDLTAADVKALGSALGLNIKTKKVETSVPNKVTVTNTHHDVTTQEPQYDDEGNVIGYSYDETETVTSEEVDAGDTKVGTVAFSTAAGNEEPDEPDAESKDVEDSSSSSSSSGSQKTYTTKIKSISKASSGSDNNWSSTNSGGSPLKKDDSGSGSTDEPDEEDKIEDEIDRYHDINIELEQISTKLSRIQNQEEHLRGAALIKNLNKQLKTLNKQISANQEKISIAKEEANELKSALSADGVKFNSDGTIKNYEKALQKQEDYVNKCIEKYNNMTAKQQKKYKDTLDKIKEDYEEFKTNIEDYDTLISETIPDLEDEITEAEQEKIEIEISKFSMELELRLDLEEAEKDWNDFYQKVILGENDDYSDDMASAFSGFLSTVSDLDMTSISGDSIEEWTQNLAKAVGNLDYSSIGGALGTALSDAEAYRQKYEDTGNTDYLTKFEEAMETVYEKYGDLVDYVNDAYDSYLDSIDEAIDKLDEQIEQYDYINDLLDNDISLTKLLYGDDAYDTLDSLYTQKESNYNKQLADIAEDAAYYKTQYYTALEQGDEEAAKKWLEAWKDAESERDSLLEEALENIQEKYLNAVAEIVDSMNDMLTDGLGLDYLSDQSDLLAMNADVYLDTINAAYAKEELRQKYLNAIDETDSISAQKKLNSLMEEQLSYLEEKENLTQYDVDRAEKLYEIALAQIALEEAQQNKSTMRLRRDANGNYTYEYAADEDSIADAQQELLSLQNELYNLDKDEYLKNLEEIQDATLEFEQAWNDTMNDMTLTSEERQEKLALLYDQYGEYINAKTAENAQIRINLQESATTAYNSLYQEDAVNFDNMTQQEIDSFMNNLVPQWSAGVQEMTDKFAGEGGFIETVGEYLDQGEEAFEDYTTEVDQVAESAEESLGDLADGYDSVITEQEHLISNNSELVSSVQEEVAEYQSLYTILKDVAAMYTTIGSVDVSNLSSWYQQTTANDADDAAASKSSSSSVTTSTLTDSISTSKSSGNGDLEVGDYAYFKKGKGTFYNKNGKEKRSGYGGEQVYVVKHDSSLEYPWKVELEGYNDNVFGWVKKSQLKGYDTGGYTGDWDGSENGALALLHQKELVLNKTDTENILNAVSLVRDISDMVTNLETSAFSSILDKITNLGGNTFNYDQEDGVLEQDVHIEASFPNVTSSSEIEDAFNNLVNVASMYANRKVR